VGKACGRAAAGWGERVYRALVAMIALLGAAALGGCGGDAPVVAKTMPRTGALPACTPIEPGHNDRFLLCRGDRGSFSFRGRGRIPVAYPYEGPAGQWSGGFLSPDGGTLLAQWTAECEVPFAFFVPARGGIPRLVTGEGGIEDARPSIAHGWTGSGEAIIEVLPGCGDAIPHAQTEIWLVSPKDGKQRRLRAQPE
jgi:hypothetical protein